MSRLFGTRLQKSQRVYFVTLNGRRFKRIILRDSHLAAQIEQQLESFGPSERLPELVARYEHEVWVGFIDGERLSEPDEQAVRGLADFYAEVYARSPRQLPSDALPIAARLHRDLDFLGRVEVLSASCVRDLHLAADSLAPTSLWLGYDYIDPVLKNFVVAAAGGRICAIDVESLEADRLIGLGYAKARTRWMGPALAKVFLEHLARPGVPDFDAYLPYVELVFLADYTKLMFLEQKWKHVAPSAFEPFRHGRV